MKLNGKLVELQAGGRGGQDVVGGATMMQAEGLRAIIKPDHESGEVKGNGERRREGALLFKIEGADEVGFWGFYSCGMVVKGKAAAKTRAESPELATNTGAEVYRQGRCYVCHGALGYGGVGPQFRGHDNLKDDKHVVGAILDGPGEMPAFADTLTNEQIAAVSTYIRTHWGNDYGSVTPDRVAEIRKSRAE
ncbi:MAG: hypothetical protein A49_10560 [Methyloceanibacter sp.]|nr:MAG: hypothetical protein A49_10560 [Methyloceanibacter sp.]